MLTGNGNRNGKLLLRETTIRALSVKEYTSFQWKMKSSSQIKMLYLSHFFLSQILTKSKETDGPSPHEKVHVHFQTNIHVQFIFW